jgi:S-adenosylmethionine:tRNA ribosyltransferase-isomerase
MHIDNFNYNLPDDLIARYPRAQRSSCRLLSLDGLNGNISHGFFTDLIDNISAGDLLIFNDARVIPARIYGQKLSGGKIEILVERILSNSNVLVHIRSSRSVKPGTMIILGDNRDTNAIVVARYDSLFEVSFEDKREVLEILDRIGHLPLPPYIGRPDEEIDYELYQTVYNKYPCAVAAPTAGLHFDEPMMKLLKDKGVEIEFITLSVGAATFQPVRNVDIKNHIMHSEYVELTQRVVNAVLECKARGNKVIAVGTTSVRSLESAAQQDSRNILSKFSGTTNIFIYPGYCYKIVDAMITNFHLPRSTLIMLVSAFAGYKNTISAYNSAISRKYLFFSYGDAMFINKNPRAPYEIVPIGDNSAI